MDIAKQLKLEYAPVGIWFTDTKPEGAFEFDPSKRTCVVSMLVAASKGTMVAVSDATCACPGGAVGLGFGDAFARRDTPTDWMLSHGEECPDWPDGRAPLRPDMRNGERFFRSSECTRRWRNDMALADADYEYVVMAPVACAALGTPDLVWMLANPDQLSALVVMCGYTTGRALNVLAPFCAGCQSIVLAKQEAAREEPHAIMGMFDISQRHRLPRELLSLTMPYALFDEIDVHCMEGCLVSHAWRQIEHRYDER